MNTLKASEAVDEMKNASITRYRDFSVIFPLNVQARRVAHDLTRKQNKI